MQTSGPVNLNQSVRIKLLPRGISIYNAYYADLKIPAPPLKIDADGLCTMQLWEVMHIFGQAMYNGCDPPIETVIHLLPGF